MSYFPDTLNYRVSFHNFYSSHNKSSNGVVNVKYVDPFLKLSGKNHVYGRSVVIHSGEDDLGLGGNKESLITGNAGGRVACAIIVRCKE